MERGEGRKRNEEWVVESRRRRSGGWSESESESEWGVVVREVYDAVVVCNGHFTEPQLADVPGTVLSGAAYQRLVSQCFLKMLSTFF